MTKKTGNDRHNNNFPNEKAQTNVDNPNKNKNNNSKTEFSAEWDAKAEKNQTSHNNNQSC
ncbi:MAG TPA: hypothetical protein VNU45_02885 [Rummeliibacillus sp.]|nr:hypothetical protein [Rummeliibacillus sp.]